MTEFHPVEHISPSTGATAITNLLLVCDHARNAVPPGIDDLGLPREDMMRHIAWDVGARGVTLGLAARLAPMIREAVAEVNGRLQGA
jgi:predicted N-formylglutamate amidohydrolase